jgi:hypothetical protein
MKIIIINYNRLTYTKAMAEWSAEHNLTPVILDNHSNYEPLLDWYAHCPFTVIRMRENYGSHVLHLDNLFKELIHVEGEHLLTDPDLDMSGVPADFLDVMREGLALYPQYKKIGLSLEIDDLPLSAEGCFIRRVEGKYWTLPLDGRYFMADVDTTFCLRRQTEHIHTALRTNRPYTARHLPWYITSFESLSDEDKNYFKTAIGGQMGGCSGKDRIMKY